MTIALEAVGLTKRYRRTVALSDCTFELPAGRIAALVGPNGAGKTTLLHLAVGLRRPTRGRVRTLGWSPLSDVQLLLPRIGFVAQDTPLYGRFTVAEMLQFGRTMNRRWDHTIAEGRLQRLAIPRRQRIDELSMGQRAQVALALALGKRPELLLLDEPLATLDPLARRQFLQELMEAAAADGLTVILSSHLIGDLERVCDHLVILNQGRVQVDGAIEDLLATHRMLLGPRLGEAGIPDAGLQVISAHHGERQSALWVRGVVGPLPGGWQVQEPGLEELVLAYLDRPATRPEPALEAAAQ
jgi:ABC-2 type transport system ATP-binding protein